MCDSIQPEKDDAGDDWEWKGKRVRESCKILDV